jgi:segregation and condensation protein A
MTDGSGGSRAAAGDEGKKYQVRLDVFEGPLDVLLRLIEDRELDITKVSLALVTDQYLAYVRELTQVNPDDLAEFLVVAAKLLLIKSRALLPAPPGQDSGEEDVGDELARQLMEYKRLKELAWGLRQREEAGLRSYVRVALPPSLEKKLDPSGLTLEDLLAAVRSALAVKPYDGPVDTMLAPILITIGDQIQRIGSLLADQGQVSFNVLLQEARSRIEVIVSFLAVLELIKSRTVLVEQEQLFGEIILSPAPALEATPEA